ncbi:hypothetical protein LV85_00086 [Algoriphagus chordae]|uniref:Uncharacterized protein n=1 Tax=Algoriphagus chordae TaxID=237019 RepID=A0A2W7RBK5_9BACT|nr:hypothetical protein LV85_00086 [Algoriphagus chordae]
MRLFTNETVEKYAAKFTKPAYIKDIKDKLQFLETDLIKKKLKLLDILSKLEK